MSMLDDVEIGVDVSRTWDEVDWVITWLSGTNEEEPEIVTIILQKLSFYGSHVISLCIYIKHHKSVKKTFNNIANKITTNVCIIDSVCMRYWKIQNFFLLESSINLMHLSIHYKH